MKTIIRNILILITVCLVFFLIIPIFNTENEISENGELPELYDVSLQKPIEDTNHVALFGTVISFPLNVEELPEQFHIEDKYYTEMTDGIDAGDYFHCYLLNADDEEIAYMRVSNLKQSRAVSPEGMTITYIEANSFQHEGKKYTVPLEVKDGIGIGTSIEEIKAAFPDVVIDEEEAYSIVTVNLGIQHVTLELTNRKVYNMSVEAY